MIFQIALANVGKSVEVESTECERMLNAGLNKQKEGELPFGNSPSLKGSLSAGLSAQTQSLDDGTVAVDVTLLQIAEQCTALTYQLRQ